MASADVMRTPVQLPPFHYHQSTPYQQNGEVRVNPVDPLLSPEVAKVELAPLRDTTAVVNEVKQTIQLFPAQTPEAGRSQRPLTPVTAIHTTQTFKGELLNLSCFVSNFKTLPWRRWVCGR